MGFIDNIIAKYFATVVGYLVVSGPFLDLSHPRHLKVHIQNFWRITTKAEECFCECLKLWAE